MPVRMPTACAGAQSKLGPSDPRCRRRRPQQLVARTGSARQTPPTLSLLLPDDLGEMLLNWQQPPQVAPESGRQSSCNLAHGLKPLLKITKSEDRLKSSAIVDGQNSLFEAHCHCRLLNST